MLVGYPLVSETTLNLVVFYKLLGFITAMDFFWGFNPLAPPHKLAYGHGNRLECFVFGIRAARLPFSHQQRRLFFGGLSAGFLDIFGPDVDSPISCSYTTGFR